MHQAGAAETDQLGLFGAPSPQGGRPFARAAQIMDLLTRFDHAAVDQAGKQRRQFASRYRNHRLVEERETLRGSPLSQQNTALQVPCTGHQIRVRKALANLDRAARRSVGRFKVAGSKMLFDVGQHQVTLFGTIVWLAFEQPMRPPKPAGRLSHLPAKDKAQAKPEGATGGAMTLASVEICTMGSLQHPQVLLVAPGQIGRHRQPFEIVHCERSRFIGEREKPIGVVPRPFFVGVTTEGELIRLVQGPAVELLSI